MLSKASQLDALQAMPIVAVYILSCCHAVTIQRCCLRDDSDPLCVRACVRPFQTSHAECTCEGMGSLTENGGGTL